MRYSSTMWQNFKSMVEDMGVFRNAHPHAVFFSTTSNGIVGARCREKEWKISAHRVPTEGYELEKYFFITGFLRTQILPQAG